MGLKFQFGVIVPTRTIASLMGNVVDKQIEKWARLIKTKLDGYCSDWVPSVIFRIEHLGPGSYGVYTDDMRFAAVDKGVPKRIITPRTGDYLVFRVGYQPKTRPIAQAHVGPGVSTGQFVRVTQVEQGIEARKFGETSVTETSPEVQALMMGSMRDTFDQVAKSVKTFFRR